MGQHAQRLADLSPDLELLLTRGGEGGPPQFGVTQIKCETVQVPMRDGARLATDLYLPPLAQAPAIAVRTPYGRAGDRSVGLFMAFARRGYIVVAQDCRGTGDSEPDQWDYYMFESEDGYDLADWISRQQWFDGFIGSCGGSYGGQTQWPMATHPAMSTIVPHVSGLGIGFNTVHLYMFCNGYGLTVGKGEGKLAGVHFSEIERLIEPQTMAGGYFNEPLHRQFSEALLSRFPILRELPHTKGQRWLWEHYCSLSSVGRADFVRHAMGVEQVSILEVEAMSDLFGPRISHDAHTIPHKSPADLCGMIQAPPLLVTGWYDWGLNDTLATWNMLRREGVKDVAGRTRIIITPHSHNTLGYKEGIDTHPELQLQPGAGTHAGVLMRWYQAVREGRTQDFPTVIYYLMGANEWRVAEDWPVPEAREVALYLGANGTLTTEQPAASMPDCYTYDPEHATPTVGGSIVSFLYPPGSVDVSEVQKRPDVLVYTSPELEQDLDVVGPLRMVLYASSSARDTDFAVRLSDVFPDGRAIQLQNCVLRARYRNAEPELLEPGRVYKFEIDLWATANRFKAGHRLCVDIASADFPRYDRNSNLAGKPGNSVTARQSVFHDLERPSHIVLSVLGSNSFVVSVGDRGPH